MYLNRHAVRAIREARLLTVSETAARAGFGQAHLSNLEAGRRAASPDTIKALAAALNVDPLAISCPVAFEDDIEIQKRSRVKATRNAGKRTVAA